MKNKRRQKAIEKARPDSVEETDPDKVVLKPTLNRNNYDLTESSEQLAASSTESLTLENKNRVKK